jgi:hypothetical protein
VKKLEVHPEQPWVSTLGRNEAAVRRYIREQEQFDKGQGQLFD